MSDLFICFTSGPSSLNRRLMMRSNSSLKTGQASSIFSNGKRKGSGLENPEPSSPKVTCIGQVRVKSKKQGKKLRACRSMSRGEVTTSSKNWVHLPLTICEALRSFGGEYFKCFLPCTRSSSSMANQRVKEEKTGVRSDDDETIKEETLIQVSFDNGEENGENVPLKEGSSASVVEEEEAEIEITQERSELECPEAIKPDPEDESKESGSQVNTLPDCLLLMMCEPKLSMEVSKETWVCKRDSIREKEKQPLVKQMDGQDEPKRRDIVDHDPVPVSLRPPPSSCPLPAAPPLVTVAITGNSTGGGGCTAAMVDQKPLVLTRCKSEPMRLTAKLYPSMVKI